MNVNQEDSKTKRKTLTLRYHKLFLKMAVT